jgi:hypothetical protein
MDFDKLGVFYLGRQLDGGLLLYDSKDLVTHGVCVGMTGSGKTGLGIGLIEEAAIDGIPVIVVDPKGDMVNLLLTFPDLRPEDFRPWINEDDARKAACSPDDFAVRESDRWKKGLTGWGQDGGRIRKLRESAEFAVYTPGSNAGISVSILQSFTAPPAGLRSDDELLGDRAGGTASSLLALLGIDADPVKSREHILISTILHHAWTNGRDLDLAALIHHIQSPPVTKLGVLDIESFYPAKERFQLSLALNNLLAAPGFAAWLDGVPLDIHEILYRSDGKPRVAVFSIAHLNDAERMFFVSLLLNQIVAWMRSQSGTSSLRAVFYMDEIFGYFPPSANPPSKRPLLTLLKQARAFGLGVMLATQNPVDLDYKGLSNTGTWFIGRLQTERDRARLLDGLAGASGPSVFDRGEMERLLSGLRSRVFLMNNVHDDAPVLFETRWTMSYLRGPFTRREIQKLGQRSPAPASTHQEPHSPSPHLPAATDRPIVPPEIRQMFLPARGTSGAPIYTPMVLGSAVVTFMDVKSGVNREENIVCLCPITDAPVAVNWGAATVADVDVSELQSEPDRGATYANLPGPALQAKNYPAWSKELAEWLFRTREVRLLRCPATGTLSRQSESEREFRLRLQDIWREERDQAVEALRRKYAPKLQAMEERLQRAQAAVDAQQSQASAAKLETAISLGATLLGALFGRKAAGTGSLGRATTTARGVNRSMKESADVGRASEKAESIRLQISELQAEFESETESLKARIQPGDLLETVSIRPKKKDIAVRFVCLAWVP